MLPTLHFDNWPAVAATIAFRYFFIAGIFWVIWYMAIRDRVSFKKIQPRFPRRSDYIREISYSLLTIIIFSGVAAALLLTPFRLHTAYYSSIGGHGMAYFFFAIPVMFLFHDAYFYWTHRAMHHPKLFKLFHLVHHKSVNPSPWAAFAFHPLEALVEVGAFALLVLFLPMNFVHVLIFFFVMMVYNVYGHLGCELYPKGFAQHWLGRWINTGLNHNNHHQYFKGNYGLYFLWWDRWMGTLREDYEANFEAIKSRKPATQEVAETMILQAKK